MLRLSGRIRLLMPLPLSWYRSIYPGFWLTGFLAHGIPFTPVTGQAAQ
jgi:hypothetical protein